MAIRTPTFFNERSELADIDGDALLELLNLDGIDLEDSTVNVDPIIIGDNAVGRPGATTIGVDALTDSTSAVAYGRDAQAAGQDATALGTETRAPTNWNTVVGYQAGANDNGENVVLIGRKAEGKGNDVVSIGENTRANADNATAVGKAAAALALNASVFGQGSVVSGEGSTLVGQGLSSTAEDGVGVGFDVTVSADQSTAVGAGAVASGEDSTAIGNSSNAAGDRSVAIGHSSEVFLNDAYGVGDRDLFVESGRSVLMEGDSGRQALSNKEVTPSSAVGTDQGYALQLDGTDLLGIEGESDGTGGIQNTRVNIPTDLTVAGGTTQVDDMVTGTQTVEDGNGDDVFNVDATASPPLIDFNSNDLSNIDAIAGDGISVTGADLDTVNVVPGAFTTVGSDVSVNIGNGLEGDGSNNIRVNPEDVAGDGLAEESDTTLGVVAEDVAGAGLVASAPGVGEDLQVNPGVGLSVPGDAVDVDFGDNEQLQFGDDDDVSQRYGPSSDELRWQDASGGQDRMALDRTTGNLRIEGELSEGASLSP